MLEALRDLLATISEHDNDITDAGPFECVEDAVNQGLAADLEERLRYVAGERKEAAPVAGSQYHRLHAESSQFGHRARRFWGDAPGSIRAHAAIRCQFAARPRRLPPGY